MITRDIGIDLGTANVLIYQRGKGIVLDEPSVVALSESGEVLAVGREAYRMVGRTPGNIVAVRPLRDGVIADFEVTEKMLATFLERVGLRGFFRRPRVLVCAPTNITPVEQKAIRETIERTGAREVWIEQEPKVAAIGAGLDIFQPSGNMVIDIGGGTTDVAVFSMGDIVAAASINVAGDKFDAAIMQYLRNKHRLLVGERTAETIKFEIGDVYPGVRNASLEVRGRHMVTGLPQTVTITSEEVRAALREATEEIVATARSVLERTPPELAADIIDRGILLTGGGALIAGMDRLLAEELKVPVFIADDPMTAVARGTGVLLEQMDKLMRPRGGR